MQYCLYLRKSRADAEAEERGDGETLARHEKTLLELAKKLRLNITEIYREVVSGETIAARPVMQHLLTEVEQGLWEGVLVMEVERLARGDTIDQGIMAQTFKFSDTKIITPMKTYDPNNEFDEEYFEFGLFMSRREYKTINRRLQRGRETSVREGKYIASIAPYGYKRVKIENDKGFTLEIVPENAEIVKLIFSLYVEGEVDESGITTRLGIERIATKLNKLKIPTIRHDYWQKETIRDILINPVYIGKVRWGWRSTKKKMQEGKAVSERPRNEDCIITNGLHPAIIDTEIFNLAQKYIAENPPQPKPSKLPLKNPFAGLIMCGKCGRSMVLRKRTSENKKDYIVCHARSCDNVSSPFYFIEDRILTALSEWLKDYTLKWELPDDLKSNYKIDIKKKALKTIETDISLLEKQLDATYTLLEQGVYTAEQFLERSRTLSERITITKNEYAVLSEDLGLENTRNESFRTIIPKTEKLLESYHKISSPALKNDMLKEVIEKIVYTKTVNGSFKNVSPDNFEIVLHPKLPTVKSIKL